MARTKVSRLFTTFFSSLKKNEKKQQRSNAEWKTDFSLFERNSKLPESQLEERLPENNSLPRLLESKLPLLEELKNLTGKRSRSSFLLVFFLNKKSVETDNDNN
jgi:hypothetical protein